KDIIQLGDVVSTISHEYLLEFTSEYGIPESLHPELPGPEEPIMEFSEGKVGVYTKFFEFANYHMDLFSLIIALNPTKVKTETRPRAAHEVPLPIATASRVIDMEDMVVASGSSGTPFALEKSPLYFTDEDPPQIITEKGEAATTEVIPEPSLEKEMAAMGPLVNKKRRKRDNEGAEANAPPKVLRKDHAAFRPAQSILEGTSLVPMGLDTGFTISAPATQDAPTPVKSVSDPDLLGKWPPRSPPGCCYHGGVRPILCEKSGVREIDLLPIRGRVTRRYLSTGVAMGSQLRLRFKQEVRLLKKAKAKIARRDQRIQAREEEAEVDMNKTAEAKNAKLAKEMESLRVQFSDLQVSNIQLSKQVSNVQAQVTGEEKVKFSFKEFKRYEDDKVEQRCAKMDARLDKLSVDVDEELYPHMLTAIAGHHWVIGHGLRLAVMKYAESLELRADRDLVAIEAYDLEADSKYVNALQDLKDLCYPLVDQLEKLKDAPMDLIIVSLYLESDTEEDAPQWIRDLLPSSSQLRIPISRANKSRAEKKKKCRGTHGVGFVHHARSDGIPASVPTIAPRGLAILLADVATQTEKVPKDVVMGSMGEPGIVGTRGSCSGHVSDGSQAFVVSDSHLGCVAVGVVNGGQVRNINQAGLCSAANVVDNVNPNFDVQGFCRMVDTEISGTSLNETRKRSRDTMTTCGNVDGSGCSSSR
nr:hypothetical protein [Tanacetum cinerariifolium]